MTNCEHCGSEFYAARQDAIYCSDKCAAQAWREGARFVHIALEHIHKKPCEYCGAEFVYNEYADRKGQRIPKFCSGKCRMAAHRKIHGVVLYGKQVKLKDERRKKNRSKGTLH